MSTFELIYNAQVEVKEPTGSSVHPGMGWLPGADPPLPFPVLWLFLVLECTSLSQLEKAKIRPAGCVNTEK